MLCTPNLFVNITNSNSYIHPDPFHHLTEENEAIKPLSRRRGLIPWLINHKTLHSIMDGGANVNLLSLSDAVLWKLVIIQLDIPQLIHFGKDGSSSSVSSYVDGGILLGKIYLIEDGAANLTGVSAITDANLEVIYAFDTVTIRTATGEVLLVGAKDPVSKLYYIDLLELITIIKEYEDILPSIGNFGGLCS